MRLQRLLILIVCMSWTAAAQECPFFGKIDSQFNIIRLVLNQPDRIRRNKLFTTFSPHLSVSDSGSGHVKAIKLLFIIQYCKATTVVMLIQNA